MSQATKDVVAFLVTIGALGLVAIVKHYTAKLRRTKRLERTPYNS